jgi:hypothetical protein
LQESHVAQRVHRQQIDGDHAAARARFRRGNLRPAARCRAEIDDDHARLQQLVARRDFDQLVRRARAIAFRLRALHVDIVDVLHHPLFAGLGPFHRLRCRHDS